MLAVLDVSSPALARNWASAEWLAAEEQIELNLGGLLRQVYTTMFSSRAECMTHTLPRDRRFESLVIQRGVNNEPCSCRRLRLVAKQRRAFPNEKQGPGNRQYTELVIFSFDLFEFLERAEIDRVWFPRVNLRLGGPRNLTDVNVAARVYRETKAVKVA
jgi:hypothetical protein